MILIEDKIDKKLLKRLKKIVEFYTKKDLELIVVGKKKMKKLNLEFRGKDRATDVLSFPLAKTPNSPLGSIVICKKFVKNGAKKFAHSIDEEFILLFIHGFLHLLGFDHEKNEKMRKEEKKIIKKFNLPKSLIVRIK